MSSVSTGTFDESRRGIPMTGIDLYSLRYTWFSIDNKNEQALSNFRGDKPTHPIGCYPCHVYLIECHSNERIRVWLQESEAQVDKFSDYIQGLQWQVYQAEAKCTEHLLLTKYTVFYTLLRKAECTLYILTKKITFFFRKLYVVLNLTLSIKISRL
jgi:hypothetical protein